MKRLLFLMLIVISLLVFVSCEDYIDPDFPISVIVENKTMHDGLWQFKKTTDIDFSPLSYIHSPGGHLVELDANCTYDINFYAVDYNADRTDYVIVASESVQFTTDCQLNEYHFYMLNGEIVIDHKRF